ncbi:MAG TPA: hypothetical protein VMB21_16585 [Candidatus Limnocylindria bacterium]|jgi:hypothetical protein|nr:hypothetical protein [Candidatus Limnocylindria bacterium]
MSTPAIITGPAIVKYDGHSFYTKGGLKASLKRNTFNVETDAHGQTDERLKSQMWEVSFTPVGQVAAAADLAPYFPTLAGIGKSIFGDADTALVIHTLAGQTITFPRAALSKPPPLRLKATDTLFGDMTFTCIGKSATEPTDAAVQRVLATTAFADTTFDGDAISTARYTAAFGDAPYDAMLSADGFELTIEMKLASPVEVDAYGIVDIALEGITASAKFAPANLTEAQLDTLLAFQGADAVLPGQSLAKAGTDLVISSDALVLTLHKAGPKDSEYEFKTGEHRFKGVMFGSRRSWTTGVADVLWTFEDAA